MPHGGMASSLSVDISFQCSSLIVVVLLVEKIEEQKFTPQAGLVVEDIIYHLEKLEKWVWSMKGFNLCEIGVGPLSWAYIGAFES